MTIDSGTLREMTDRLDAVLRELDAHADPAVRERAHEAVELLLTVYGAAFERALALAGDPALGGVPLVTHMADDPIVGPLLVIHGLHPHDPPTRVARALDRLRPRVAATGCRASLQAIDGRVAHLRIAGRAKLGAESAATLRAMVETAVLEAAPELSAVSIEDVDGGAPAAPPPLIQIMRSAPAR